MDDRVSERIVQGGQGRTDEEIEEMFQFGLPKNWPGVVLMAGIGVLIALIVSALEGRATP